MQLPATIFLKKIFFLATTTKVFHNISGYIFKILLVRLDFLPQLFLFFLKTPLQGVAIFPLASFQ